MADLMAKRERLAIQAEIEALRRVAAHPEVQHEIALACLERANRLADELKRTENGGQ